MISSEETNFERIENYWKQFLEHHPEYAGNQIPQSFYFCYNEKDANECAELVVKSIKRATSISLRYFEKHKEKLPKVNDLYVITDCLVTHRLWLKLRKLK